MRKWMIAGVMVLGVAGGAMAAADGGFPGFPVYQWGLHTDIPLSGDFDGDKINDLIIFRPATGEWYGRRSGNNFSASSYFSYQWGLPGDVPIIADLSGDGRADFVVWRPANGTWYVSYNQLFGPATQPFD